MCAAVCAWRMKILFWQGTSVQKRNFTTHASEVTKPTAMFWLVFHHRCRRQTVPHRMQYSTMIHQILHTNSSKDYFFKTNNIALKFNYLVRHNNILMTIHEIICPGQDRTANSLCGTHPLVLVADDTAWSLLQRLYIVLYIKWPLIKILRKPKRFSPSNGVTRCVKERPVNLLIWLFGQIHYHDWPSPSGTAGIPCVCKCNGYLNRTVSCWFLPILVI